jgi:hypothetical protein
MSDEEAQMTDVVRDFWLSWYCQSPISEFELHSPWWVSGYGADDSFIVVAAVRAADERAAFEQVRAAYDNEPEGFRERFCEPLTSSPFSGRFLQSKWMAWDSERTCGCEARHPYPPVLPGGDHAHGV